MITALVATITIMFLVLRNSSARVLKEKKL
jgi:hypothetical protein